VRKSRTLFITALGTDTQSQTQCRAAGHEESGLGVSPGPWGNRVSLGEPGVPAVLIPASQNHEATAETRLLDLRDRAPPAPLGGWSQ